MVYFHNLSKCCLFKCIHDVPVMINNDLSFIIVMQSNQTNARYASVYLFISNAINAGSTAIFVGSLILKEEY